MHAPEHRLPEQTVVLAQPHWFTTTHWSLVLGAGPESPHSEAALEKLCRSYWLPIYGYLRKKGRSPRDAQDVTEGFFQGLLRTRVFDSLSPNKGKFRTFLLTALNQYLADERNESPAVKRGGGQALPSLDEAEPEKEFLEVQAVDITPEQYFDRRWTLKVLEHAMERLRRDYLSTGRQEVFEALKPFLSDECDLEACHEVAIKLGMTQTAMNVAVQRLRQRYRELIRLELANTVTSAAELEEEMKYLLETLSRR